MMNQNRQTILVVEDERLNIDILSAEFCGDYHVLVAKDGRQAFRRLENNTVDLILLDIVLPEINGFDCLRLLKRSEITKDIPVIIITSKSEVEDEATGLQLGAVDFIRKPFNLPIVRARVKTHLDLKRKSELLETFASVDALTNLPNRRKVDEMMQSEWRRAVRIDQFLTYMLVDVDHFKQYNDNYGHQAGDDCLRKVAQSLRGSLPRAEDFVGRYGGEEFLIILPNTDLSGAMVVVERIRSNVEGMCLVHQFSSTADHVTISLGVASTRPARSLADPEVLLGTADRLLFRSKEGGRNRFAGETV
jgi:diguanylate cyclase (GGDEF)-like protein